MYLLPFLDKVKGFLIESFMDLQAIPDVCKGYSYFVLNEMSMGNEIADTIIIPIYQQVNVIPSMICGPNYFYCGQIGVLGAS